MARMSHAEALDRVLDDVFYRAVHYARTRCAMKSRYLSDTLQQHAKKMYRGFTRRKIPTELVEEAIDDAIEAVRKHLGLSPSFTAQLKQ